MDDQPVKDAKSTAIARLFGGRPIVTYVILGTVALWTLFWVLLIFDGHTDTNLISWAIVGPAVVLYVWYKSAWNKAEAELIKNFAQTHGLSFSAEGSSDGLSGTLFQIGHDKKVTDSVRGIHIGKPFKLFLYEYTEGHGRYARTSSFTVLILDFQADLPQLILRPRQIGEISVEPPAGLERVELEGDFDSHFHLFITHGGQVPALEVFAPDLMQKIMQIGKDCTIEFNGSSMVLSVPGFASTQKDLDALLETSETLSKDINPVAQRMHYDASSEITEIASAQNRFLPQLSAPSWGKWLILVVVAFFIVFTIIGSILQNH